MMILGKIVFNIVASYVILHYLASKKMNVLKFNLDSSYTL